MISTTSSRKHTEKVSSDSSKLSYDLLTQLTYMAALATGGTPRDTLFERAVSQQLSTAIFFRRVYLLSKRLGFEYGHAFQLVASQTQAYTVRSLLLRFSSAISSGESEHEFLQQESRIEGEKYIGEYTRKVESLQKWGDAYAAFLVSSTLIVVVTLISTMLYDMSTAFLLLMAGTVLLLSAVGVFVIFSAAPYEVVAYRGKSLPALRQRAVILFWALAPVGAVAALILLFSFEEFEEALGWALVAMGASLVPAGVFAHLDDAKVRQVDQEVASFVRALGNVSASLGSTLAVALGRLDRRSMGALEPYLARLQGRLDSHLNPDICWERFREEIGSGLVDRSTRMFVDGTALGGSPDKVGAIARDYAMSVALLRAKRRASALPFAVLVIPLHTAMTALLIFIMEVMRGFNQRLLAAIADMGDKMSSSPIKLPNLQIFHPKDLTPVIYITMGMILILVISNTLVPKLATGGHTVKLLTYGSIMCLTAGMNLLIIPPIVHTLLTL